MMSEFCLFCDEPGKNYKPGPHAGSISSGCVQMLLMADQDGLKRAHKKATELGFHGKANALESFIESGGHDAQRKPKSKKRRRCVDGKRVNRVFRNKKERIGRSTTKTQISVL